ncbi:hypothetical protein OC861_005280 [Tilletia horrida]|nr:hypothetical protein OC861_005280 [Tilletia horrida]
MNWLVCACNTDGTIPEGPPAPAYEPGPPTPYQAELPSDHRVVESCPMYTPDFPDPDGDDPMNGDVWDSARYEASTTIYLVYSDAPHALGPVDNCEIERLVAFDSETSNFTG